MTGKFSLMSDGYYAPPKDPDAVLDYSLDWSQWLGTDTISVSVWTVPAGLTKVSESLDAAKKVATIWLSGGTAGAVYTLKNRITTAGGRIQDQTFKITVREN